MTIGFVALAFVAGSIMTGTMADAASQSQGQPFQQVQFQIDSFFDVFFDVTTDGTRNTIDPLVPLFGDPDFLVDRPEPVAIIDSFFDIFVEIDARDRHFDTEIVSMQLSGGSPLTVSNIGSSGLDGVQIALPKGSLQSQINTLELRIAELEGGDSKTCEDCTQEYQDAIFSCPIRSESCLEEARADYDRCISPLPNMCEAPPGEVP